MLVKALLIWISILEIALLYWLLCGTVLEIKTFRKKEWGIIFINMISMGVIAGINRSMLFFSQNMFMINVAVTCVCIIVIDKQNRLLKAVIVTLYYTSAALLDFFFAFLSMMVLEHEFDRLIYSYANSWTECMLFTCSRIMIAGCISEIVKKRYDEAYLYESRGVLLIITIFMCLLLRGYQISIVRMIFENREQEAGIVGISLVGILMIVFLIIVFYLKNKTLEKEKEFLTMRDEMVRKKFIEMERIMEENRQLSHDLKNHMIVLKNYVKERDYAGIHNYIEEIEKEYFETSVQVWTGNKVADILIEQKKALAEQEGISFTVQAVPIAKWPFNDSETCSLLGNLLDNSIDACKRINNREDRWISVKIENQKQLLFIKVRNSIDEAPIMKNGRPISAKQDKKKHGYGLKSVERIIYRYEGVIRYQIKEKVFQTDLSI